MKSLVLVLTLFVLYCSSSTTVPLVSTLDFGLNYINLQDSVSSLNCAPVSILLIQPHLYLSQEMEQADFFTVPFVSNAYSKQDWKQFFASSMEKCAMGELKMMEWDGSSSPLESEVPVILVKDISSRQEFHKIHSLYPHLPLFYTSVLDSNRKFKRAPNANQTSVPYSKRSLFQKYVFFNNAVFLGLIPMLIVLVISLIGVRILLGIQSPTKFETKFKQL